MPMERHLPRIRVRSRQLHSLIGQRLVLQIDSWDRTSNYPNGHIVRVLGPCNDLKCAPDGKAEVSGSGLHGWKLLLRLSSMLNCMLALPILRHFCLGCHLCTSDILVGWQGSTATINDLRQVTIDNCEKQMAGSRLQHLASEVLFNSVMWTMSSSLVCMHLTSAATLH